MPRNKILIVEDEKVLNEAYQTILKKEGYDIAVAYDGEEALIVAEHFKPNLILLDLRMPKLDGIGFLKKYNATKKHKDVEIIVFSNLDSQSDIDTAYELGAKRYILKAWATPKELVNLVAETLKVH